MYLQKTLRIITIMTLFAVLVLGCTPTKPNLKNEIDIRGNITNVSEVDAQGKVLLIEGSLEEDTKYDKASITINDKTKIYEKFENDLKPIDDDLLTVGKKVEAVFIGPVAESYPVQATAKEIIILE